MHRKKHAGTLSKLNYNIFINSAGYLVVNNEILVYFQAMKLVPDNKSTLVARSRCYQLLGKPRKAMQDVESALNIDPLFYEVGFMCTLHNVIVLRLMDKVLVKSVSKTLLWEKSLNGIIF